MKRADKLVLLAVIIIGIAVGVVTTKFIERGVAPADADKSLDISDERKSEYKDLREKLTSLQDPSCAFAEIYDFVSPSVVLIVTEKTGGFHFPGFEGDFFERMFPGFGNIQKSQGSGLILTDTGYIVTNFHVVRGAREISVALADKTIYPASVYGVDPFTDLAVIKIDAKGLSPAKLGDSDTVRVGDWALALGTPFGYSQTFTAGIISAKGRHGVIDIQNYENFIQTDAAINPGNSGGPLFNIEGEVIGLNVAISTGGYSQQNAGIAFAIPCNTIKWVTTQLIDLKEVVRGYVGVDVSEIQNKHAKALGLASNAGALVARVHRGGGAVEAGIEEGDIILEFDGKPVIDAFDFRAKAAVARPESAVPVKVLHKGKEKTVDVKIGKAGGFRR